MSKTIEEMEKVFESVSEKLDKLIYDYQRSRQVINWLLHGNTGVSSKCIISVMYGIEPHHRYTPSDPSDFLRCLLLLEFFPDFRERLYQMKSISKEGYFH